MSQKKKMDKIAHAGYKVGFSDACEFWELAVASTKYIGPKRQKAIMETVTKLIQTSDEIPDRIIE